MTKISKDRTVLGASKYEEDDSQTFKDLLDGKYDKKGFKVSRVFRTEDKEIIKVVFIKDGVFVERDLGNILKNKHFEADEFES